MKFEKKFLGCILAHLLWPYLYIFAYELAPWMGLGIVEVLHNAIFTLVIYPIITNILSVVIYKVKPLEDGKERRKYIICSVTFTVCLWMYMFVYLFWFDFGNSWY